jgi:hypothetical protein
MHLVFRRTKLAGPVAGPQMASLKLMQIKWKSHFPTSRAVKYLVLVIQPLRILKQNAGSANFPTAMSWIAKNFL